MSAIRDRFKDAPWFPKGNLSILVGGAGGIGSWTTILLSRIGYEPVVFDFDIIEEHNIGGQLYPKSKINQYKVEALNELSIDFCNKTITHFKEKIDSNSLTSRIAISAFDNMKARSDMFESWDAVYGEDPGAIFIDGRLNAEQMQIFCIRGGKSRRRVINREDYRNDHLFNDADIEDEACTMKQTSHAAAMIASHMVGFLTNHITNVVERQELRTVPFYWEYFIPMHLTTEII